MMTRSLPVFVVTLLLLTVPLLVFAQVPDLPAALRHKLDAPLLAMADRAARGLPVEAGVVIARTDRPDPLVACLVQITAPDVLPQIAALGGRVGSLHGDIATVRLPLSRLGALAHLSGVRYVEAACRLYPQLDLALPDARVDVVQGYTIPPDHAYPCDGSGVLIGLTDSGTDFAHGDFLADPDSNGHTRVLWLWDQTNSTGSPPSTRGFAPGWNYGSLWSQADMNDGLCAHQDTQGHGTHVAGILAGDGSATGNGEPAGVYAGCAPRADLIVVRNLADQFYDYEGFFGASSDTLDAWDFIRTVAEDLGRPHVINTSQGSNLGPHDGSTLFEQGLNNAVAAGSLIVVAAGNTAAEKKHFSGLVPPAGQLDVLVNYTWDTPDGALFPGPVDLWYSSADRLYLEIRDADGEWSGPFDPDVQTTQYFDSEGHQCSVTSTLSVALNGDNRWLIYLDQDNWNEVTWTLRLTPQNSLPDGGLVHLWAERNYVLYFPDAPVPDQHTLSLPATAQDALTVAGYTTKLSWTDAGGVPRSAEGSLGEIGSWSGRGPLRVGAVQKPDLAAPGRYLASAASQHALHDPALLAADGVHVHHQGTSMAAPVVTGLIALMLQKNAWTGGGTLTPAQIRQTLLDHCASDAHTGTVPNATWGFGKLRGDAAWNAVPLDAGVTGFTATPSGPSVRLTWELTDDLDCLGFDLYRAASLSGPWVRLNSRLLPPRPGPHAFTDSALPLTRGHYLYRLDSVAAGGVRRVRATTLLDLGRLGPQDLEAETLHRLTAD